MRVTLTIILTRQMLESEDRYDIILLDAAPVFRSHCAEPAAGLIEVDVTFSALEANLQTTSLFLSRDFDLPRGTIPSPAFPFSSPGFDWDTLGLE
jgi:hypothetical protein